MKSRRNARRGLSWSCVLATAVVLVAPWTAACGGSGDGGPAPPAPAPVVYTEADDGTTVEARVGDRFTVSLAENPTTGYVWEMKAGPGLALVGDEFAGPSPSPSPLMGAGGTHSWVFRVDEAGTLTLTGVYARPWEAEGKSAAEFSLTIAALEK